MPDTATVLAPSSAQTVKHFDVLIVGAGISGICAAHHLTTRRPGTSFAILEGREEIGGTWSLFRYPGIRSDSDMYTLGYRFRPWPDAKAIAEAMTDFRPSGTRPDLFGDGHAAERAVQAIT